MASGRKTVTEDVRVTLPRDLTGAAASYKEALGLLDGLYARQLSNDLTLSLEKDLWSEIAETLKKGAAGLSGGARASYEQGAASLARGEAITVLELNGVTSEATHIYDPRVSPFEAWRTLCEQWRIAFEIGARNRALGHRPASIGEIARLATGFLFGSRREARRGAG